MKKPRILDRFTTAGRLRRRLAEVREKVQLRQLARMDAGDLVGEEIASALKEGDGEELRPVLFEAETMRAILYHESSGATALDASRAVVEGHAHFVAGNKPEEEARKLLPVATAIVGDLEELGSCRNLFSVTGIVLDCARPEDLADAAVRHVLVRSSSVLRGFLTLREQGPVGAFLKRAAALLQDDDPELTETRRDLFRVALAREEPIKALALFRQQDGVPSSDLIRLARLLAARGIATQASAAFLDLVLTRFPEVARNLESHLERLAAVADHPEPGPLPGLVAFNDVLVRHYPQRAWPCINLARAASWTGDEGPFLAWLLSAWDRGWRPQQGSPLLLLSLWALGFRRAAGLLVRTAGDDHPCVRLLEDLRRSESLLSDGGAADWLVEDRRITETLAGITLPRGVLLRVHFLRARLQSAAGGARRAVEFLHQILGQDPAWRAARMGLADAALKSGDLEAARQEIGQLIEERETREVLLLQADLLIAEGARQSALALLEKAVEAEGEGLARSQRRSHLLREACAIHAAHADRQVADSRLLHHLQEDTSGEESDSAHLDGLRRRVVALAAELGDHGRHSRVLGTLAQRKGADRETLLAAARSSLRGDDPASCSRLLQRLLRRDPEDPDALSMKGLVAMRDGRLKDARRFLSRCHETRCAGPGVVVALATLEAHEGRPRAALELLAILPDELPPPLALEAGHLRAALLEHSEDEVGALKAWRAVLVRSQDPVAKAAYGRLAIHLGHGGVRTEGGRALLTEGAELLAEATSWDDRCYLSLAEIALGGRADPGLLDQECDQTDSTEDLEGLASVLRHEMLRSGLELGDDHLAARVAEGLDGPGSQDLKERVRIWRVLRAFERLDPRADAVALKAIAEDLRSLPRGPVVGLALELIESLGGPGAPRHTAVGEEAPPRLCLAVAQAWLTRGRELDRVRALLARAAAAGGMEAAWACVLMSLLEPDRADESLLASFEPLKGLRAPISREQAQGLVARARYLLQVDARFEEDLPAGMTAVHARVAAALELEAALRHLTPAGDPRALADLVRRALELVPSDSAALPVLERTQARLRSVRDGCSLATLWDRLAEGNVDAAREMGERLAGKGDDPTALHHLALLAHARAFAAERDRDPASPGHFAAAHGAWQRFLEHPSALQHLSRGNEDLRSLKKAVTRLRRDIVAVHVTLAAACVDDDPERAAAHGRLVVASDLVTSEREQLRTDLYLALTDGFDESDPERVAALSRRLEVLLHADPSHQESLALLLRLECEPLAGRLSSLGGIAQLEELNLEQLAEFEEPRDRAACAVEPLVDEMELYASTDEHRALMIGVWHLADAVVRHCRALARGAEESAVRALEWLERGGERGRGLLGLARELQATGSAESTPRRSATADTATPAPHADVVPASDEPDHARVEESREPEEGDVLEEVESLIDTREWNLAEARLLEIHPGATGRSGTGKLRRVIDLLTRVRDNRRRDRQDQLRDRVEEHLEEGRYRKALDLMSGRDLVDAPHPELLALSVKAHLGTDRADLAEADLRRLEVAVSRGDADYAELASLREVVVIARAIGRLGRPFRKAYEALGESRPEDALEWLAGLRTRHPADAAAAWLRAVALDATGRRQDARMAMREALTLAEDPLVREVVKALAQMLEEEE